jgi:ABC-2 type transport system permease protein
MNNIKKHPLVAQLKREILENKVSLIYAPLILSGLMLLLCTSSIIYFIFIQKNDLFELDFTLNQFVMEFMYANCAIILLLYAFVLMNYLLGSLYEDRKTKQILFWRSMPVSETTNVLMKVFVVAVVAPTCLLLINECVTLLVAIVGSVFLLAAGASSLVIFSSPGEANAFIIPFEIYMDNLQGMPFMLPLIGYFLLISAFSKKFPMAIALGAPAMLLLIDYLLGRVGLTIGIGALLEYYAGSLAAIKSAFVLKSVFYFQVDFIFHLFCSLVVGGLLIVASIWLRNNRYEI